ncbi:HD-GYP domain-containing protein, partial [Marinobacter sp.]|uniref:HD-GYP domain-containing protein n=1 Tax=Marinobacter sp. TaxID=50741 RepID=UPI0035C6D179
ASRAFHLVFGYQGKRLAVVDPQAVAVIAGADIQVLAVAVVLGEERMAEAAAEVRARLGAAIYGQDGETMEAVVGAMLADSGLSRAVLSVVQGHRERHNGSGFPEGIRGDRIPLLAKVAGIAEFFESLIGPRESALPMTPDKAVSLLYEMRNIEFQEDLVESFIQAIGIYPTGSLVELTDGQRGVVVSHSPERRLWPRVMVMTDSNQLPMKTAKIVDLAKFNESRDASESVAIRECLPHGAEGLDPSQYDVTGAESRWSLGRLVSG